MSVPAHRLRQRFTAPGFIRIAGAHNALGAKLVERNGFEGVWSSGLEISTSHAVPDASILTMSEYLAAAQGMAAAVSIPVVADCDTGYGNSSNVIPRSLEPGTTRLSQTQRVFNSLLRKA